MADNQQPVESHVENQEHPQGDYYQGGMPQDQYAHYRGPMGYDDTTISSSISTVSAYVGNLHPSTTREDLQTLFSPCGNIRRVAVPLHPTGQIKGCGYVEFEDSDGLQAALQLHNSTLNGQVIDVYPKRDTVRHPGRRGQYAMMGYGRGYGMMNPYDGRGYMPYGYPNYAPPFMGYPPRGGAAPMYPQGMYYPPNGAGNNMPPAEGQQFEGQQPPANNQGF